MRRVMIILFLIGALSLAACGDLAEGPGEPAPVVTDTLDDLAVARAAFERGSAEKTYSISIQISAGERQLSKVDMAVDAAADAATVTMVADEYQEMVWLGDELLVKQDDGTFLRVEVGKLRADGPLRTSLDLARASVLPGVLISRKVEETAGTRVYEGRLQLQMALDAAPAEARKSMGATVLRARNAQAVPFRLGVDAQGRLLRLTYEIETTEGLETIAIRMSGYGTAVTVVRPKPEQVKNATSEHYAAL
ncbi:hypothetical protein AB0J82_28065 [Asanoa sp. NPDC049518]|uniref:hypothetical protein n=1 Tax=unclassified Asanoa TaxID=2685164 RepID=UPI003437C272